MTALTRRGGQHKSPAGVRVVEIDYNDRDSLVAALKGQQFLVITLPVTAPHGSHSSIGKAAVEAGVPYIMPNVYAQDVFHPALREQAHARSCKAW